MVTSSSESELWAAFVASGSSIYLVGLMLVLTSFVFVFIN